MASGPAKRVLFVEHAEVLQQLYGALFEQSGFRVTSMGSANAALDLLRRERVDVLMAEQGLDGQTGTWLIETARAEGLLDDTSCVLFTAAPGLAPPARPQVLTRTLAVDGVIGSLNQLAQRAPEPERLEAANVTIPESPLLLTLYVAPTSPGSLQARRNLARFFADNPGFQVSLQIRDVTEQTESTLAADRIGFTPTLVIRGPSGARIWLVGSLDDLHLLEFSLLRAASGAA